MGGFGASTYRLRLGLFPLGALGLSGERRRSIAIHRLVAEATPHIYIEKIKEGVVRVADSVGTLKRTTEIKKR